MVGKHSQGSVIAHGAERLLAGLSAGADDKAHILECIAKSLLPGLKGRVVIDGHFRRFREVFRVDQVFFEPLAVGLLRGDLLFELFVFDDAPLLHIDEKHAAGFKATFFNDIGRIDTLKYADFGRENHLVVGSHIVAGRAQTVAVERRADLHPVRHSHGGRPVPWLHQASVELIEIAFPLGHALMALPGLGNHHHHGVCQAAAREYEKLKTVVELLRVRTIFTDNRK